MFRTIILAVACCLLAPNSVWSQPVGVVVLELQREADAQTASVTIQDIAKVTAGDVITRRKIAGLDLAELKADETATVSKRQVETRILLSGISANHFKVLGPDRVLLRAWSGKAPEAQLLEFMLPEIAERLGAKPEDVELKLTRPIADAASLFSSQRKLQQFLPSRVRVGAWSSRVGVYEGQRLVKTEVVHLDVRLAKWVFVAARELERGAMISPEDVVRERRVLAGARATSAATEVDGKELTRKVRAGQIVSTSDVRNHVQKLEYVIQSRDIVEVVARRKSLQVRISGAVALQRGKVGDSIRVKSPRTQRVLTAQVVDAGLVQIKL